MERRERSLLTILIATAMLLSTIGVGLLDPATIPPPRRLGNCVPSDATVTPEGVLELRNIQKIQHIRMGATFRLMHQDGSEVFFKVDCIPPLNRFRHGAQSIGEVLMNATVELLQLPVVAPCLQTVVIDKSEFHKLGVSVNANCGFRDQLDTNKTHYFGIILGKVEGKLLEPYSAAKHPIINEAWGNILLEPLDLAHPPSMQLTPLLAQQLADFSTIFLIDTITGNMDRGKFRNWFYSEPLDRFIVLDNGFFFGFFPMCREHFGLLQCSRTMLQLATNYREAYPTPLVNASDSCHALCRYSRATMTRIYTNVAHFETHLESYLLASPWVRHFQLLESQGTLKSPGLDMLRRQTKDCRTLTTRSSVKDVIQKIAHYLKARVRDIIRHVESCQQKFGTEFTFLLP